MLEDLEARVVEYRTVGDFLEVTKKEFGGGDDKSRKVAELKKIKEGDRIMEEYIRGFRRVAREGEYKGKPLIEKFKCSLNSTIWPRLMELECQPGTIRQWYKYAINLDRDYRKSRRKEKERRKKIEEGETREARKIEKEWKKIEEMRIREKNKWKRSGKKEDKRIKREQCKKGSVLVVEDGNI